VLLGLLWAEEAGLGRRVWDGDELGSWWGCLSTVPRRWTATACVVVGLGCGYVVGVVHVGLCWNRLRQPVCERIDQRP
jgi:hypothetical protein